MTAPIRLIDDRPRPVNPTTPAGPPKPKATPLICRTAWYPPA